MRIVSAIATVIQHIWKLKISDQWKYTMSLVAMAVGLGFAIWTEQGGMR